ncbi:MAG TPA: OmpA family protein [Halomicronema sp.]
MNDFPNFEQQNPSQDDENSGVLLSIGDLMSGLLMFFALMFILVQVQLQQYLKQLETKINQVTQLEKELQDYRKAFQALPQTIATTLEGKLGTEEIFTVDPETGDVSVRDKILFDENSAEIKPAGKQFLQAFIPLYSQIVFSNEKFEKQITRIVIEGHTSSTGTPQNNLNLSLRRALAVSNYIDSKDINFPTKTRLKQKILVSGRGEIDANQTTDDPKDRKVVFRFQFRQQFLTNESPNQPINP